MVTICTFARHTFSSYPAVLIEEAVDGHLGFHPHRNTDEVHRLQVEGIPSLEQGERWTVSSRDQERPKGEGQAVLTFIVTYEKCCYVIVLGPTLCCNWML